ncbi:MAG: sulfatase [Phycisphaerae bacterium]
MIRNILLIVVDCLRADHVGCYGYDKPTTPTVDRLAGSGCLWQRAYSASSWTKPSVASLLTGLYPTQHGAFRGVKRSKISATSTTDAVRSTQPVLAESLSAGGWRCGAFINNAQLGSFTRLDRGFSAYAPSAGKADRLIGIFLEWLEANQDRPTFAYLHFLDTHWPYQPRRRHVAMFGGNRDTNMFRDYSARDYAKLRQAIANDGRTLSNQELEQMVQMYDGSIRRVDAKLRIILAMLTELGLRDETAIFITADHGEELLDHGQIGHGQSLHEELTHVPLIAHVPGGPAGIRHADPVSHVDLAHTIECLAGVDARLSGANLLDSSATPRAACSELMIGRRYSQVMRSGVWSMHRRYKIEAKDGDLDARQTPRQWVTGHPHRLKCELYNTAKDPSEQVNRAKKSRYAETKATLAEQMDQWWEKIDAETQTGESSEVEIDALVVQRLRDLGYIE